jgi:hypothetical protein
MEKSESVQNTIANKCWFQQHEILFLDAKRNQTKPDWDEILQTPGQICFQGLHNFWARSNLWIDDKFKNSGRNWGFLGFLERVKLNFSQIVTKICNNRVDAVVRGVQLTINQFSNQIISKESKVFHQKHKRGRSEEQVIKTTPISVSM